MLGGGGRISVRKMAHLVQKIGNKTYKREWRPSGGDTLQNSDVVNTYLAILALPNPIDTKLLTDRSSYSSPLMGPHWHNVTQTVLLLGHI